MVVGNTQIQDWQWDTWYSWQWEYWQCDKWYSWQKESIDNAHLPGRSGQSRGRRGQCAGTVLYWTVLQHYVLYRYNLQYSLLLSRCCAAVSRGTCTVASRWSTTPVARWDSCKVYLVPVVILHITWSTWLTSLTGHCQLYQGFPGQDVRTSCTGVCPQWRLDWPCDIPDIPRVTASPTPWGQRCAPDTQSRGRNKAPCTPSRRSQVGDRQGSKPFAGSHVSCSLYCPVVMALVGKQALMPLYLWCLHVVWY